MIEHELYFENKNFEFLGRVTFPYRLNVGDVLIEDWLHPFYCEIDDSQTEGILRENGEITKEWFDFIGRIKKFRVVKITIYTEGIIGAELAHD
jgi:hypothetical protein